MQLDAIEKQKENKPKITEEDKIVYLKDEINKLFEMYSKSFTSQGKKLLKILPKMKTKLVTTICLPNFYSLILHFI